MIRAVRGTRDILPPSSAVWNHVEDVAREVFRVYNYGEIRTPLFEETILFARGVGEETDIVSKEMYTFEDRDGSSLTLRPEATASVIRACIEHRLDQQPGLIKLYYIGPMFRRERPQKGRYRQFYQIGAECVGSESPLVDAEVIELVMEILRRLELTGSTLLINSVGCPECRPAYVAGLREQIGERAASMCPDCRRRAQTNALRVLDCKVPEDQPIIDSLPSILLHLCAGCSAHFEAVQQQLNDRNIPFQVWPRMVRGLDYYTRTTFEVVHGALGSQNSVLGGGRYDGLAEQLGSKVSLPGIGFSIGQDRLVMILEELFPEKKLAALDVYVAPVGGKAAGAAARLAGVLRALGACIELGLESKLKKALDTANRLGARYTLLVGDDEIASGRFTLKNMSTGEQERLTEQELASRLLTNR